jgi:hypothetical protein
MAGQAARAFSLDLNGIGAFDAPQRIQVKAKGCPA